MEKYIFIRTYCKHHQGILIGIKTLPYRLNEEFSTNDILVFIFSILNGDLN